MTIEQPEGTRICGQIAVAHLANVPLDVSLAAFGHARRTTKGAVIRALYYFGYRVESRRLRKTKTLPALGIGKMRWRRTDGKLRGWHWVAIRDGQVIDGQIHNTPGEVTSWLVVENAIKEKE